MVRYKYFWYSMEINFNDVCIMYFIMVNFENKYGGELFKVYNMDGICV